MPNRNAPSGATAATQRPIAPARIRRRLLALALLMGPALLGPAAQARAADKPPPASVPASTEPFPNLGQLYKNDKNPWVQELWFLGRYHGQYHWSGSGSQTDQGWENRRFRIGGQARFFQNLTVHVQMVSGPDMKPFYNGFTELWVGWKFNDALTLTVGQQKHRFTHDRNVSSRYINYLERSMLTNMFALDYTPAVTLSGKVLGWSYYAGVFSNATSKDIGNAFTDYDSGYSLLGTATKDLGWFKEDGSSFLNVSFVHSDANDNATNLNRFDNGVASALILTEGPVSLVTELTMGFDDDNGNGYGLNLQPGWFLTQRVQVVGRYQIAGSNEDDGLKAQRRYERDVGLSTGDLYQAGYFGINYYLAEHRMKLMTGVEYSDIGGQHCWTGSLMIRLFWGPHSKGPFPMAQVLRPTWDDAD